MNAVRAARKIVKACVAGRGEVAIGLPAKLISKVAGIAPNLVGSLMGAANDWLMPGPADGHAKKKGCETENPVTRSPLTALTRRAELANNQTLS